MKPLKKKTLLLHKNKNEPKKSLTMENADNVSFLQHTQLNGYSLHFEGVGALYIIMDTIRRKRAEQREQELKQQSEERFHNGVNKGRELLRPLP